MTVQNTIVKNVYVGNGSTTVFPFTFECNKAEHIQAFVKDAAGNISSTTNFKVNLDQKNVTYPNTGEPLPDGYKLIILRQLPLQQLLNLLNQGPFYAEDIEETFDEVVMMLQQMTERIGRSLAVSIDIDAENSFNTIIPLEAGKTFRVKDDGTGFEVTEDPGKVIDGAKALLKQTMEQAELAKEQAAASSQSAVSAQNAANTAEKIATDLGLVDEAVQTAVSSAEQASNSAATASNKADVATTKADIATAKASEASTSADTATQKAESASTSATNAAQSYANADAIATQLTEYLATKETLTAPAVDKTLLIEGAAADAKVVGELKGDLNQFILSDLIPFSIGTNYRYINADGSTTSSGSHTTYIFNASDIRELKSVRVFGTNINLLGIAFYTSDVLSADTFISGYRLGEADVRSNESYTYNNIDIPTNAVIICISNRYASGKDVAVDGVLMASAVDVVSNKKNIEALNTSVNSNTDEIDTIKEEALTKGTEWTELSNGTKYEGQMYSYVTGILYDDSSYCSTSLPCEPNTIYKLVGAKIGSGTTYPILFMGADGKVISVITDLETAYEVIVTTPENCAEIRYSQLWNNSSYKSYYGQYSGKETYVNTAELIEGINFYRSPKGTIGEYIIGEDSNGNQTVRNGSDSTFVNKDGVDYKLTFFQTDDAMENAAELRIQAFENGYDKSATYNMTCYHKFGHCNTVDYNKHNDCLIFGNGSGDYSLLGKFYIIPNAKALFIDNATAGQTFTLENTNAIEFDCSTYNFGAKLNALWGEQNGYHNNIAYLITDDNGTIRRILLGTGSTQRTYGVYTESNDGVFNGTFDVLDTYTHDDCEYRTCNQGSQYYNGKIVCGIGHDGLHVWAITLNDNNKKAYVDEYYQNMYDNELSGNSLSVNGLCIDSNGTMILGSTLLNANHSTMAIIYPKVSF